MKFKRFIFTCFFISIFLPLFFFNSFCKYIFENTFLVANVKIDNSPPEVQLISFNNSNLEYPNYANRTHTITAKVKVIEEHIKNTHFDSDHIKIKVNNKFVSVKFKKFSYTSPNSKERIYEIVFTDVPEDGLLSLHISKDTVIDEFSQGNISKEFSSNILIDNTAPIAVFSEETNPNGYSKGVININEGIQPVNGWNISSNNMILVRDFPNPIEYELPVKDFAQNSSSALVSIKKATNINLEYGIYEDGNHRSYIVNSGNISGDILISSNSIYKAEALFLRTSGDIDSSFLRGRAFLYTYYGEGSSGVCNHSELTYNYGYNPKSDWRIINKEHLTYVSGKIFSQFGGSGVNFANNNASKPFPEKIAKQYLYGISGVSFSLADYSQYSIVYQIYVKDIGWLPSKYNGQEAMYRFDKPISAIRINLVPNSERQHLINYWDNHF